MNRAALLPKAKSPARPKTRTAHCSGTCTATRQSATQMIDRCGGTGKYRYDGWHITICPDCCPHDQGSDDFVKRTVTESDPHSDDDLYWGMYD